MMSSSRGLGEVVEGFMAKGLTVGLKFIQLCG